MLKCEDEICSNTGIAFRSLRQDFMFELETHFIALTCYIYIYIYFDFYTFIWWSSVYVLMYSDRAA